ncbi:hypothetical protein [Phenylobacterium sp.]|uniref:hypothetical protein n=1 Tax=Phenylobacterium sp. TaxID=1871053 RepID=UPI0025E49CD5|nr:hypothetical protein [Phenylobacterium sp.]
MVLAGVVVAAALGVGLGLWARPGLDPEPVPAAVEAPPELESAQPLQIVVDDRPAPLGAPLVVLPPSRPVAQRFAGAAESARPPGSLPVVVLARAEPEGGPPPKAKPPPPPRIVVAKAEKPPARPKPAPVRVAKAEKAAPKAPGAAKVIKAKAKAPVRKKPIQVASAESPKRAPKTAAKSRPAKVELASARPPRKAAARAEAPRRVAQADPCALPDRAEAMVCADSRLSARDRQMRAAYREAEAAGVPTSALRRQQVRWLAAREAAAREAPWAVEDVYVARIAELKDLVADAREN